jgi:hypothetical protein
MLEEIQESEIGMYSYFINPSKHYLRLSFDENHPMEIY